MDVVPRSAGETPTAPTTPEPSAPVPSTAAPSSKPSWYGPVSTAAVVGAATLYTAVVNPNTSGAFPQCITKRFTGLDCPMCGGLRTVHSLSHGDLAGALDHNALVAVLLPLVVVAWALWAARSLGVDGPRFRWPRWAPWAAIAFSVVFAVVRNTALPGLAWLDSGV